MVGYAPMTITSHLSAISFVHKLGGMSDPAESFMVKKLMEAIRKWAEGSLQKLPITLSLLHTLLDKMDVIFRAKEAILYKAIFSLAFHLSARKGELTISGGNIENVIKTEHVQLARKGTMLNRIIVEFKQYQHKASRGQCTQIVGATQDKWCPVQLLSNYLTIRNSLHQTVSCPLFVTANGRPVQGGRSKKNTQRVLREPRLRH